MTHESVIPCQSITTSLSEDAVLISIPTYPLLTTTFRPVRKFVVAADISGGMQSWYQEQGMIERRPSLMEQVLTHVVSRLSKEGFPPTPLFFFSREVIHRAMVQTHREIQRAVHVAKSKSGAFRGTDIVPVLSEIAMDGASDTDPTLVLVLTDGSLDDCGLSLRQFYEQHLLPVFQTRERFLLAVIEVGGNMENHYGLLKGFYGGADGPDDLVMVRQIQNVNEVWTTMTNIIEEFGIGAPERLRIELETGAVLEQVNEYHASSNCISTPLRHRTEVKVRATDNFSLVCSVLEHQVKIHVAHDGRVLRATCI